MKSVIIILLFTYSISAQQFKATVVKGDVKFQSGTSEVWSEIKSGELLPVDGIISTGKNSSLQIKESNDVFNVGELSAVSISSIKEMTTDELLLALALEDMLNVPKTNGKNNSNNTATYGNKEGLESNTNFNSLDFGVKRLNGAMQLAENELEASSVVFARETYRKYPETKNIASYRIFFADILYSKGLYEEALSEYLEIQKLELNKVQKESVDSKVNNINKILLNE